MHSEATDEPLLAIPKPAGWTFSTRENSSLVRGALSKPSLEASGFTPSFVVALANVTGDASTPEQALDTERAGRAQKVKIDNDEPGTQCGYPSRTLTYTYEGRASTTLMIAAEDELQNIWISTVDTQTIEPNNPEYLAAKRTILDGFQFSLPNNNQ
ncbi:hypothetical protein [Mycobacterium shimoidei]|uniref:hypothetical protein n=1 Tax=Mycobacterium shimoidei TaxID=29313 RepID=UPI00115B9E93|nr:hypothetical protein [Mycobacterium shimoidei]